MINNGFLFFRTDDTNLNALLAKTKQVCDELKNTLLVALGWEDPSTLDVKAKIELHEALIESSKLVCTSDKQ